MHQLKKGQSIICIGHEQNTVSKKKFYTAEKFSVNITSISVMAVPILAVLIDYFFINVEFSELDLLALIFIVSGIYVVARKPFNKITSDA